MGCFSGPEIVNDGLVFYYDMNNRVKSWKGKPVENLVASGQRTCSSGLTQMSYHREAYTYVAGISSHGRKDVIKVTCSPTGTDSIAPYADFGFSVSRSGGSQVGDVYWISFDYKNIRGGSNPSIDIVYANGYKQPDGANVGTFEAQITTDLENGWKRVTRKCTMTAAGASWWRFGQSSGNEEVEFYLDNFQIIHSDVDAPFVDGTRSSTEALLDLTANNIITASSLTYNTDGTFDFNSGNYALIPLLVPNGQPYTILMWVKPDTLGTSAYNSSTDRRTPLKGNGHWNPGIWATQNTIRSHAIGEYRDNQINWSDLRPSLIGMTFDGTTVNNVFDGVKLTGTRTAYSPGTPTTVFIGAESSVTSSVNWDGKIYSVYYYDRALSADEIKQNFENTRTQYGV